jgi:hypothetical protein
MAENAETFINITTTITTKQQRDRSEKTDTQNLSKNKTNITQIQTLSSLIDFTLYVQSIHKRMVQFQR